MSKRIGAIIVSAFIFICSNSSLVSAKSLDDAYGKIWSFYLVYSGMSRTGANSDLGTFNNPDKFNYLSFNFSGRGDNTDQYDMHFDYQNRYLGDLMNILYHSIKDMGDSDEFTEPFKNNHLHNGILGDMNIGMNVIGEDELVVSTGLNIADHLYENSSSSTHHGYYLALGLYAHADYAVVEDLNARLTVSASKAVTAKATLNSPNIYKPLFISIQPEIFTSMGLFAGMDIYYAILDSPVKQTRTDFKLGWRF